MTVENGAVQDSVETILDRRRRERRAMRHGGGTECERGVFRAKRKRERVSARPIARHMEAAVKRHAERSLWAAKPHDGASDPVRTRIAFAATHVADNAGTKIRIPHSSVNMVLQENHSLLQ